MLMMGETKLWSQHRRPLLLLVWLLLAVCYAGAAFAQTEELGEVDPIKLFERGQNAHARGDLQAALSFYEQAIKLRPEFPEAEFQRGSALIALNRPAEAEPAFRRAIELRKDWSLPYSSLGVLLLRGNRAKEAEPLLQQAIKIDAHNTAALRGLAEVRLQAGDAKEAARLARSAAEDPDAPASAWVFLAYAQAASKDKT